MRRILIAAAMTLLLWGAGAPAGARDATVGEGAGAPQGCESCHKNIEPMHESAAVRLSCTDCHGGDAAATTKEKAHVLPLHPEIWKSSANPQRTYTALLDEPPEFVKFVNPGDLRVVQETCGRCHQKEVNAVPRSTMTTSAIFWAAVSYANGILPTKNAILGESYSRDGK